MGKISVYITSENNPYPVQDDQIYIATEKNLKDQIRDAEKINELVQKDNSTSAESLELKELAGSVMRRAKARLTDLHPKYRHSFNESNRD